MHMCPPLGMGWVSSHASERDPDMLWDGWVGKFDLPNCSYGRDNLNDFLFVTRH